MGQMPDASLIADLPAGEAARATRQSAFAPVFRHRLVQIGGSIILLLVLLALAAPVLTRCHILHQPDLQDLNGLDDYGLPRSPGGPYLLGTDDLGRDVLARVIYGTRVSLTVGTAAMLTATSIGLIIGLLSGFYGGKLDMALMRFTDMNLSIPAILLAIVFAGLMDGKTVPLHPAWLHWDWLSIQLNRG